MLIDKSWIYIENHLSDEYCNGLSAFIEIAKNYENSMGLISCPCMECRNHKMDSVETVRAHINRYGFDTMYTNWIHHGEIEMILNTDPVVSEPLEEISPVLNDVARIPDHHDMLGEMQVDREDMQKTEVRNLLPVRPVELYPGCTKYSLLNFLEKLTQLKMLYKWPNECIDAMLKLLNDAFPEGNKLPPSYYEVKNPLSKLGLRYANEKKRHKKKWSSSHGPKSYSHLGRKDNTTTQQTMPVRDNWADMHQRGITSVSPQQEQTFNVMEGVKEPQIIPSVCSWSPAPVIKDGISKQV